jgi:hypothetical protein
MVKNLKNTVLIDTEEYNLNAVYSDEAGKVSQPLTIKKSLINRTAEEAFDGSENKLVEYVPATGGKYKGLVLIDNSTSDYISAYNSLSDNDKDKTVINSGQIDNRIVNLTGAPLCVWNASFNPAEPAKNLYALKESSDKVHSFTVITGPEADLQLLQDAISGTLSEGSQELSYSLYSSLGGVSAGLKVDRADNASGVVVVPAKHYGTYGGQTMEHNVSAIGEGVFSQEDAITGVVISQGVGVVGKNCFNSSKNLKYVVIPDSIYELGGSDSDNRESYISYYNQCFYGCSGLKTVLLGTGIKSIGRGTFQNCTGLTSIVIPKNVTTIGREAFKGCTNLISIVLPAGLTSVADNAFADCSNLKTVYYTGQEANWANIAISSTGNSQLISAQKVYDYVVPPAQTAPSAPNAQVDISAISNSPILYICEDDESITVPASNKIFLKLPGDSNFIEISKGAARLESPEGAATPGYYTYETLAAIIAGINSRLTALGSTTLSLPTVFDNTGHVIIPEELPDEILTSNKVLVEEDVVPTVQQLEEAISKIQGKNISDITGIIDSNEDSITKLRADLNDLTAEVTYELDHNQDNQIFATNSRIDNIENNIPKIEGKINDLDENLTKSIQENVATIEEKINDLEENLTKSIQDNVTTIEGKISDLEETDMLTNLKSGYVTKTVGGITANKTLSEQLSETTSLEDLIRKLLGIQTGIAPSGLTITISPSSIEAALNAKSQVVTATWQITGTTTYTGNYTPTIGGKTGSSTTNPSGTISEISLSFDGAQTSVTVTGQVSYDAGEGFTGNTLEDSATLTIQRKCFYGPKKEVLTSVNRTTVNSWTITTASIANDFFVIRYPKAWGTLSSIIDNDTNYEALGSAFSSTPDTVTENGGDYYQYETINKQNGAMNFTLKT